MVRDGARPDPICMRPARNHDEAEDEAGDRIGERLVGLAPAPGASGTAFADDTPGVEDAEGQVDARAANVTIQPRWAEGAGPAQERRPEDA